MCVVATGCYCFVVANKKPDPGAERRRMERQAEEERRRPKPSREVALWWLEQKAKEYGGGRKAPKSPGKTPLPSPPPKGKEKENASLGDALKGLTSEGGTGSLLKGMLRYMTGK